MRNTKYRGSGSKENNGRIAATRAEQAEQPNWRLLVVGCQVVVLLSMLVALVACGGEESKENSVPTSLPATASPASVAPTAAPTPTTPPVPLAAVVNDQPILLADYERRVSQYEQPMLTQGLDPDTAEGQTRLAEIRQEVLDNLIDAVLIEQGSASLGVSVTDADLEAKIASDIESGGGQAAFDEWLQATGLTREDYVQMLREALLAQRVMDAVTADTPQVAEQVHARQIVVDSKEVADQVLAELQLGADFAATARDRSTDLATKDNGGDLGWFPRGLVPLKLENLAFALQPGEIGGPLQLEDGYHFVQVMERDPNRQISSEMQGQLKLVLFERWLEGQRAKATIIQLVEK